MDSHLEDIQSSLSSFVSGLALQGQSLRDVVNQVLSNLSRTLIESGTQSFVERFLPFIPQAVGQGLQGRTGQQPTPINVTVNTSPGSGTEVLVD